MSTVMNPTRPRAVTRVIQFWRRRYDSTVVEWEVGSSAVVVLRLGEAPCKVHGATGLPLSLAEASELAETYFSCS